MSTNPLHTTSAAIIGMSRTLGHLREAEILLDRLEGVVQPSRAQRAPSVQVSNLATKVESLPNGSAVPVAVAAATGNQGQYKTRIVFQPKQGFKCTCPDSMQRRVACKHVSALAVECRKRFWTAMNLIEADVERLSIQLVEMEEAAKILSNDSLRALSNSVNALKT